MAKECLWNSANVHYNNVQLQYKSVPRPGKVAQADPEESTKNPQNKIFMKNAQNQL